MSILFPQPEPPPEPRPRRTLPPAVKRWLRRLGSAVAAVAVLWAGGWALLNSGFVRERLLAKVRGAIAARTALVEVGDGLEVDWLGRVRVGPIAVRAAPEAAPFLELAAVRIRPSYRALLAGRAEPATVTVESPLLKVGHRGEALRQFVSSLRRPAPKTGDGAPAAAPASPRSVTLIAEGLRIQGGADDALALAGPFDGRLLVAREEEDGLRLRGSATFVDGGRLRVAATRKGTRFQATVEAQSLGSAVFADALWERLPVRLVEGQIDGTVSLEGASAMEPAALTLSTRLTQVTLSGERLAPRPVGPLFAGAEATVRYQPEGRTVVLEGVRASFGPKDEVAATASAKVGLGPRGRLEAELRFADVRYEALLQALPQPLRPDDSAPLCSGPFDASLSIRGPLSRPEEWEVRPALRLERLDPPRSPRERLLVTFEHTAVDAKGRTRNVIIGPESGRFAPLSTLPEYVVRSVLLSEDAGFYGHDGFEFTEIHDSLIAAIRGTRFRGASTLTQQLAKNLYLSREKTLARKVKEALITIALEVSVPKDRLLEIYLNLIEWGPNLYGLGEASEHYFGVAPRQLRPKQAAFLATIIPNPNRYYFYFQKGALTPVWEERVRTLLTKLRDAGHLDEAQYQTALVEPLGFVSSKAP